MNTNMTGFGWFPENLSILVLQTKVASALEGLNLLFLTFFIIRSPLLQKITIELAMVFFLRLVFKRKYFFTYYTFYQNTNATINKKDANSVIGVFQEVLIKLYYIPILLYIEGQDDIY